ncbi:MAG: hypothetical protein HY716_06245 [Planctomycetes bacterium]|nr:hypothetical protein [Planctomycetota bacterium]
MPICIYCGEREARSREHYLSRGFGSFGYPQLLGKLCGPCNGVCRQLEGSLLRSGPEAIFRRMFGISGRSQHRPSDTFYERAYGSPQPAIMARHPENGLEILWVINTGQMTVRELRQIVLRADRRTHCIPVLQDMTPAALREDLQRRELDGARFVTAFFAVDEAAWMTALLWDVFGVTIEAVRPPDAPRQLSVVMSTETRPEYYGAIAKVAFHYFLAQFPDDAGSEDFFRPIRDFIAAGVGTVASFVSYSPTPIEWHMRGGQMPRHVGHILIASERQGVITALIQFFVNPDFMPLTWRVNLARNARRIAVVNAAGQTVREARGHYYRYFTSEELNTCGGHPDGEVIEVSSASRVSIVLGGRHVW